MGTWTNNRQISILRKISMLVTMLVKKKSTGRVLDLVGVEGFEPPALFL
jgi:hypothetical protein